MIPTLYTIEQMIASPDKETVYLAACLLRKSETINPTERQKLLDTIPLEDKFKTYEDICLEYNEVPLTPEDVNHLPAIHKKIFATAKLQHIAYCLNKKGDSAIYYPYFDKINAGSGLSFQSSGDFGGFGGAVAYFLDSRISDFIGKTFIDLYTDLL